ncbi:MAG: helix-turn-helix domain-containing protein [Lachnospiraceae bacterium]|nr:helix-turn-helix domain-containing protein [Lachnospiraceae bacterium]
MKLKISENIKQYRKKMNMTQEELAEALGVTVGAVSKWENGNNVPDVVTMMDLADFFNISMDELLSFDMSSKKIEDMCKKMDEFSINHRFDEAISVVNDALSRYPHNFVVLASASAVYYRKTLTSLDKADAQKAIDIMETAIKYISQSKDKMGDEYSLKSSIAQMYRTLDPEKSLSLLKEINFNGDLFNEIGLTLLDMDKTDEALHNFTESLLLTMAEENSVIHSMVKAILKKGGKKDLLKALDLLKLEEQVMEGFSREGKMGLFYKMELYLVMTEAMVYERMGDFKEMEARVKECYDRAVTYDSGESTDRLSESFKFYYSSEEIPAFDAGGSTAIESVESMLTKKRDKYCNEEMLDKIMAVWNAQKTKKASGQ